MSIAFSNGLVVDVDLYPVPGPSGECHFKGDIPGQKTEGSKIVVDGCLQEDLNSCTSMFTCTRYIALWPDRDGGEYSQHYIKGSDKMITLKWYAFGEYWLQWTSFYDYSIMCALCC